MRNLKENRYAQRLIEDWRKYGKIIVAVEYDNTIKHGNFNTQEYCDKIIDILKVAKEVGIFLVVFTASDEDRYEEIIMFCQSKHLEIDSINENPIELPYGARNKVCANIFIDSRAGLEEAIEILEFSTYTIRSGQHSPSIQTTEF